MAMLPVPTDKLAHASVQELVEDHFQEHGTGGVAVQVETSGRVPTSPEEHGTDEEVWHLCNDFAKAENLPRVKLCLLFTGLKNVSVGDKLEER